MSRQLEARLEVQQQKANAAVLDAVYGGLEAAVVRAGGELTGFNVRLGEGDVLAVLKAVFPGGAMVGFVGAESLADVLRKATREAGRDMVKWRPDKW
jgi:hypothetical protein